MHIGLLSWPICLILLAHDILDRMVSSWQGFTPFERQPVKSLLSMTGIASACAIMIAGTFTTDAVDFMVDVQFRLSQRQDMAVTFTEPTSFNALFALKRTRAERLSAEAAVREARSDLERARSRLRYSAADEDVQLPKTVEIRSPDQGVVLKIHRDSEGVVTSGEPLLDIGDTNRIEVQVEVLSEDGIRIELRASVIFDRWGGESALRGAVRVVEPTGFTKVSSLGVEEQRVLVIADIEQNGEAAARLGDGYRVEASFIVWEGEDVLQVPASALFRKGNDWAVFVVEDGRASLRKVQVGHRTGLAAQIIAGLKEGEAVITHPEEAIEDGTAVRPRT